MANKRELQRRIEEYKEACHALDRLAAASIGARAVIVTYRVDDQDRIEHVVANGGCCEDHVVRALARAMSYVMDHSSPAEEEEDEDEPAVTLN